MQDVKIQHVKMMKETTRRENVQMSFCPYTQFLSKECSKRDGWRLCLEFAVLKQRILPITENEPSFVLL